MCCSTISLRVIIPFNHRCIWTCTLTVLTKKTPFLLKIHHNSHCYVTHHKRLRLQPLQFGRFMHQTMFFFFLLSLLRLNISSTCDERGRKFLFYFFLSQWHTTVTLWPRSKADVCMIMSQLFLFCVRMPSLRQCELSLAQTHAH